MLINQISVFLENKPGQLKELVQLLADSNIDLHALSLAESQDYGMLRIIVDKVDETMCLLKERGWPSAMTPVLSVTVPDEPGSLTKILSVIAENGETVEYSYAFLTKIQGKANIILRVNDNEKIEKLLVEAGIA